MSDRDGPRACHDKRNFDRTKEPHDEHRAPDGPGDAAERSGGRTLRQVAEAEGGGRG
ncbi:hypothetical protein [Streptomyces sp. NPDC057694]|uniref:hypothetical protein n=1 Tax=Streptomyces sp. NPDC057694 TaxID=3346216 RepID=UPI00369EC2B0